MALADNDQECSGTHHRGFWLCWTRGARFNLNTFFASPPNFWRVLSEGHRVVKGGVV